MRFSYPALFVVFWAGVGAVLGHSQSQQQAPNSRDVAQGGGDPPAAVPVAPPPQPGGSSDPNVASPTNPQHEPPRKHAKGHKGLKKAKGGKEKHHHHHKGKGKGKGEGKEGKGGEKGADPGTATGTGTATDGGAGGP